MDEVVVRPFEARDRQRIRQICCDTADKGEPVEHFFPDRETFADLLTRYYTDDEPGSTWVAEQDGKVVGYLTGCLNTRRYWRAMLWRVIPQTLIKGIFRGAFFYPQTWKLFCSGAKIFFRGGFRKEVPLGQYPAHLHVNVTTASRGHHAGERLIQRFIEQAKRQGAQGIHLVTREDNLGARQFFERNGFSEISRHAGWLRLREAPLRGIFLDKSFEETAPLLSSRSRPRQEDGGLSQAVVYGKKLR